jgi:hypothetical protein
MSLPIKYSYSGADCKAVAFYSDVDDYAYRIPSENDGFFTYTTTAITADGGNIGQTITYSSREIERMIAGDRAAGYDAIAIGEYTSGFTNKPASKPKTSEKDYDRRIKAYNEGLKQRRKAIAAYEARFKSTSIVTLDSLATISYSIYEAKSPVRRLGERGVSGYTRGIRTIAGSMVFLVIEEHPLHKLIELQRKSKNWSRDLNTKGHSFRAVQKGGEKSPKVTNFVSTILEPFNIGLFYKTEVAFNYNDKSAAENAITSSGYIRSGDSGAHLVISGIDIISEGMVTSVNDMVTEVTVQFVAQDVFNIEKVDHYSVGTIAEYKENQKGLSSLNNTQGRSDKPSPYKSDLYSKQSALRVQGDRRK